MGLIALFVSSVLVNNILLARFLGCCPFLGVSSQLETANYTYIYFETAKGMGVAVVFVTTFAAIMSGSPTTSSSSRSGWNTSTRSRSSYNRGARPVCRNGCKK